MPFRALESCRWPYSPSFSAELIGGNGFISAFVAGAAFGNTVRHTCSYLFEFMESEGQLLMLITFLVFGATLLPEGLNHVEVTFIFYAVLSLTVIRMVPIALSLLGSGHSPADDACFSDGLGRAVSRRFYSCC